MALADVLGSVLRTLGWLALLAANRAAFAEDGYDLWLRYRPLPAQQRALYAPATTQLVMATPSPTLVAAKQELTRGLSGLLEKSPALADKVTSAGALLVGTPRSQAELAGLDLGLQKLAPQGYVIRAQRVEGQPVIIIAANDDVGVLYGVFHF